MSTHPYCVEPSHWHVYPVPDFICAPGLQARREAAPHRHNPAAVDPVGFAADVYDVPRELVEGARDHLDGDPTEDVRDPEFRAAYHEEARRIVRALPRPTPAEQNAAALDYAETALSEAWEVLRRIRDGEPDPRQIAADLLDAHGFAS